MRAAAWTARRTWLIYLHTLAACSLYGHPQAGETVNAYEDFAITWDCSCLGTAVKGGRTEGETAGRH